MKEEYLYIRDLIFCKKNLAWLVQCLEPVREESAGECCDFVTKGCHKCLSIFFKNLTSGLCISNKIMTFYGKRKDGQRHYIAFSLLSYKGESLYGYSKFCGDDMNEFFLLEKLSNHYGYTNFNYNGPYSSLFSVHKDDTPLNLFINEFEPDFFEEIALYYLRSRARFSKDKEYIKAAEALKKK